MTAKWHTFSGRMRYSTAAHNADAATAVAAAAAAEDNNGGGMAPPTPSFAVALQEMTTTTTMMTRTTAMMITLPAMIALTGAATVLVRLMGLKLPPQPLQI